MSNTEKMKQVVAKVDSISKRMDSMEKVRKDAELNKYAVTWTYKVGGHKDTIHVMAPNESEAKKVSVESLAGKRGQHLELYQPNPTVKKSYSKMPREYSSTISKYARDPEEAAEKAKYGVKSLP